MKIPNPFIHDPHGPLRDTADLTGEERQREIEQLRDALTYHNYLRSVLKEPEIPEATYLSFRKRLSRLEDLEIRRV